MLSKILSVLDRENAARVVRPEEEIPKYPPENQGVPAAPVERLLADQRELIARIRHASGAMPEDFERFYVPVIRRYAGFVHLLPASRGHHHRGLGGLLHHGLEVAYFGLQLADRQMFALREYPSRRREIEPRWRCAVFVAALAHDIGKPASDVEIHDEEGSHTWNPYQEGLAAWFTRHRIRRYFIQWRENRHQRHESLSPLLLDHVLPQETKAYLAEAGPEVMAQLMRAIASRDFEGAIPEGNKIYPLIKDADSFSTKRDINNPERAAIPGVAGVPVEKHLMEAIEALIRDKTWHFNKPGSPLWTMDGSIFLVWPAAARDMVSYLYKQGRQGIPRDTDKLAEILLERGLALPREAQGTTYRFWVIRPDKIAAAKAGIRLYALRLSPQAKVVDEMPADVPGVIEGHEAEKEEVVAVAVAPEAVEAKACASEAAVTPQGTVWSPQPAGADEAQAHEELNEGAAAESERRTDSTEAETGAAREAASEELASRTLKEAREWLTREGGLAGEVLVAVADDFARKTKQWGKHGILMPSGELAIRHPGGWSGCGIEAKEVLSAMDAANWLVPDPYRPVAKVREVSGFGGGGGRVKALVLSKEVASRFERIASGKPAEPAGDGDIAQVERGAEKSALAKPGASTPQSEGAHQPPIRPANGKDSTPSVRDSAIGKGSQRDAATPPDILQMANRVRRRPSDDKEARRPAHTPPAEVASSPPSTPSKRGKNAERASRGNDSKARDLAIERALANEDLEDPPFPVIEHQGRVYVEAKVLTQWLTQRNATTRAVIRQWITSNKLVETIGKTAMVDLESLKALRET